MGGDVIHTEEHRDMRGQKYTKKEIFNSPENFSETEMHAEDHDIHRVI